MTEFDESPVDETAVDVPAEAAADERPQYAGPVGARDGAPATGEGKETHQQDELSEGGA